MYRAFVDTLRIPGGKRPVGKRDGLPDPGAVRLDLLPGVLLPDELRVAPGADMHLLHVHADQAVAGRAHQRREPTREETGHQARLRRRRRLRRLLVPYTGKETPKGLEGITFLFLILRHPRCRPQHHVVAGDTGDQVPGDVPAYHGDDNGADSQSYSRLHQQLHKPFPLRLPQR